MPIYEYECRQCQRRFETLVLSSGEPVSCPGCASAEVDKRFSAFAVGAESASERSAPAGCGRCGDPRGPGACGMD